MIQYQWMIIINVIALYHRTIFHEKSQKPGTITVLWDTIGLTISRYIVQFPKLYRIFNFVPRV